MPKVSSAKYSKLVQISLIMVLVKRKFGAESKEYKYLYKQLSKLPATAVYILTMCIKK